MKTEDWITIETLYRTKSLSQAAKELYVSQPALTVRLKNIEKETGCPIAVRNNKGLSFLPEGEYLAEQAQKILHLMEDSMRHVKGASANSIGTIRMAVPATIAKYFLPQLLQDYKSLFPNVRFDLEVSSSSDVEKIISDGKAFCGFVHGDYGEHLSRYKLATMPAFAVSRIPITLEQLETMPFILHNTTKNTQDMIQNWWNSHFKHTMDVCMDVKNIDICLRMVESDFGVGIVFGDFFKKEYHLNTLPLYQTDGTIFGRNIWFLYTDEMLSSKSMCTFLNFLQAQYPEQLSGG